jgi:hypothetical protein
MKLNNNNRLRELSYEVGGNGPLQRGIVTWHHAYQLMVL